ncbi:MAG TPA: metallophosphoesterase [Sphingobacteriaceae bacterium]
MWRSVSFNMVAAIALLFSACDNMEYSPNQKFDKDTPSNLNAANIERLLDTPPDDTLRFILSGDTQRGYSETADFVEKVNRMPEIDFVLLAGDISDFGLLQEMEWMAEIYAQLEMPYIAVVGNHDLAANGDEVFKRVFGDLNFSFVYDGYKFVCLNTNSREANFNGTIPDLTWLNAQMQPQPGISGYFAVSHVSPFSIDFDKKLEIPFVYALQQSGNCLASLHAHDHSSGQYSPYGNGIPFIVANAILNREFTLIEVINGELEATEIQY